MAGRVVVEAPDAPGAKQAAQKALERRSKSSGDSWSLGVLRPLTPFAPGTHLYAVTFALWESTGDRFVRHDVHTLEVWATDATCARRLAQQEIQQIQDYLPSWRIRSVVRATGPKARRASESDPE